MASKMVFNPRASTGWIWVGVLGLALLLIAVGLSVSTGFSGPFMIMIVLTGIMGSGFLLLAVFFPTMRYEIEDNHLTMIYGPLLRYTLEIAEIESIRRRDLGISVVSSFRFPGLAIFTVPYPEIGAVKMCATAASNGILLIETRSTKYGLTPADEEAFVAEIRKRMGR